VDVNEFTPLNLLHDVEWIMSMRPDNINLVDKETRSYVLPYTFDQLKKLVDEVPEPKRVKPSVSNGMSFADEKYAEWYIRLLELKKGKCVPKNGSPFFTIKDLREGKL
jgi:hypothetical protein